MFHNIIFHFIHSYYDYLPSNILHKFCTLAKRTRHTMVCTIHRIFCLPSVEVHYTSFSIPLATRYDYGHAFPCAHA